jgi:hypothetical protein
MMQRTLIHLLIALFCWLPAFASAATQSIHVEWGYTPPSEPAVTGFKLYQEGAFVCQTEDPGAIAMDCDVTLTADTTNFTLTAAFSDGTESPHSAALCFFHYRHHCVEGSDQCCAPHRLSPAHGRFQCEHLRPAAFRPSAGNSATAPPPQEIPPAIHTPLPAHTRRN